MFDWQKLNKKAEMAENLIASIENDWRDMEKDLGKFQVSETNNNLLSSSDQLQ